MTTTFSKDSFEIWNSLFSISEHPLKRRATRRARSGSVRRTGSRNRRQGSVRSRESSTGFDRSSSIRSRPNGLGRRQKLSCDSENNKSETQKLHSKRDVETGSSEVFLPKPPEKSVKDQIYNIFSNGKSAEKNQTSCFIFTTF